MKIKRRTPHSERTGDEEVVDLSYPRYANRSLEEQMRRTRHRRELRKLGESPHRRARALRRRYQGTGTRDREQWERNRRKGSVDPDIRQGVVDVVRRFFRRREPDAGRGRR